MRKPLYPTFTVTEHIQCGRVLKDVDQMLGAIHRSFPKNHTIVQAARRLERALISLRSRLDDEVCRVVPRERDPRNLAIRVHYGQALVKTDTPTNDKDDFAEWVEP